ncbi:MAG TPA: sigma-70 family RNA polymerase sigma factor [Crenotrichaceae bacterium]|nr:sigma-70 family RNA polymerase sigma factor [Crenotrichaceae bacterium]
MNSKSPLSPEAAKNLVFDHWNFLTSLARKRFPNDTSMGDQALTYVLDKVEEQDWQRARGWDGCGSFATFIAVLANRLMTDFVRSRFGYNRAPTWLLEKKDVVWQKAYKLYAVDKYERREAIEILHANSSEMNRTAIEEIVTTVYAKCTKQARFCEGNIGIDQIVESSSVDNEMQDNIDINSKQLIEILVEYIQSDDKTIEPIIDDSIQDLLAHLRSHISMSDEDRLLLRLRFCEGLKIKEISQMLHIKGNPYKRINGLIDDLRVACQQSGLIAA